jgi:hypothetical protein
MEHPNFVKVCLLINKETFHVFIPTGVYKDGNTLVMKNNEIAVLNYQREIMFKQNYILPNITAEFAINQHVQTIVYNDDASRYIGKRFSLKSAFSYERLRNAKIIGSYDDETFVVTGNLRVRKDEIYKVFKDDTEANVFFSEVDSYNEMLRLHAQERNDYIYSFKQKWQEEKF